MEKGVDHRNGVVVVGDVAILWSRNAQAQKVLEQPCFWKRVSPPPLPLNVPELPLRSLNQTILPGLKYHGSSMSRHWVQ